MESAGIIHSSSSPWAIPLHMVLKKNGSPRLCRDYRRMNSFTVPDRYTIPLIGDAQHILYGKTLFSVINLKSGYNQVTMHPDSILCKVVPTPFGLFDWLKMPVGIRTSGSTFQRLMHQMLGHLLYCFIYIDDVIVASDSVEQRRDHLQAVFTLLQANHLVINKVLGKQVGEHGICRLRSSLSAFKKFPPPRKFCQGLAEVVKPMTDSLADKPADFKVTPDFMTACNKAKE